MMADTMRAVRFHDYGGPEVLQVETVEIPPAGAGQVLVRIHAASVNPIDWKLRQGVLKAFVPVALPAVVGQDLAGVVVATGPDVTDMQAGDEVFAMTATTSMGAYAEYAVVDRSAVALKPRNLDFVQAACVPMGALTAWQALVGLAGIEAGTRLFVHAAGGNVGGMAVQIALALGAGVTGAARTETRPLIESYGACRFIDYAEDDFDKTVRDMDVVFDTLGGDIQRRSAAMLRPGGILVSALAVTELPGIRTARVSGSPSGTDLGIIAVMVEAGQIRPNVAAVLRLDEAAKAQEMSQAGGAKGKLVLKIG